MQDLNEYKLLNKSNTNTKTKTIDSNIITNKQKLYFGHLKVFEFKIYLIIIKEISKSF